jgi:hypothetical protein
MAVPKKPESISILKVKTQTLHFNVLGDTPLIHNRLSEKAKRELILPAGRKTAADRQGTLKHEPYQEFRASPYTLPEGETLLALPSTAFKGAMRSAAIDMPGAAKAQIGRLTFVESERICIYGIPQMFSTIVRCAGMNRTPDVRTRAICPRWAAKVSIKFVTPMLNATSVANLLAAAGMTIGVGDWRPEKGSGNYGRFSLVDADNKDFAAIVKNEGRKAQEAAMLRATPYDIDTEELLSWFDNEAKARGFEVVK